MFELILRVQPIDKHMI